MAFVDEERVGDERERRRKKKETQRSEIVGDPTEKNVEKGSKHKFTDMERVVWRESDISSAIQERTSEKSATQSPCCMNTHLKAHCF